MGLPILLFAAALAVRVAAGLLFTGPGYLDAFYYVDVARQLAAGHGLNVPFVWAYLEVGGHIPTVPVLPVPADAHWLPLASFVQVPFIWLLGPTGLASGLPFWLAGAAAAPLTYFVGLDAGFERWQAIVGGALVAVPGALTAYMAQPDNFGLYLFLGTLALWLCSRGLAGDRRAFVLGGLLVGLGSLARNDGVLLGVPFALAFLLERWRAWRTGGGILASGRIGWPAALGCIAAFALVMAPWYIHQIAVFGTPLPSAATGRILWITDYDQLFSVTGTPTIGTFLAQGVGPLLQSRVLGLVAALGLFAYQPFAIVLAPLAVLGAWLRRHDRALGPVVRLRLHAARVQFAAVRAARPLGQLHAFRGGAAARGLPPAPGGRRGGRRLGRPSAARPGTHRAPAGPSAPWPWRWWPSSPPARPSSRAASSRAWRMPARRSPWRSAALPAADRLDERRPGRLVVHLGSSRGDVAGRPPARRRTGRRRLRRPLARPGTEPDRALARARPRRHGPSGMAVGTDRLLDPGRPGRGRALRGLPHAIGRALWPLTGWHRPSADLSPWLVAAALLGLALLARAVAVSQVAFPPTVDSAYYVGVAERLASGQGLTANVLWTYASPPLTLPQPAFSLWMPLASLLAAIPMIVTGATTLVAAQASMIIVGAALAPLTWYVADQAAGANGLIGRRRTTVAVGSGAVAALFGPFLVTVAGPDSSVPFAVLAVAACCAMPRALDPTAGRRWGVALGVLLGLAYLARQEAIWLGLTYLLLLVPDARRHAPGERVARFVAWPRPGRDRRGPRGGPVAGPPGARPRLAVPRPGDREPVVHAQPGCLRLRPATDDGDLPGPGPVRHRRAHRRRACGTSWSTSWSCRRCRWASSASPGWPGPGGPRPCGRRPRCGPSRSRGASSSWPPACCSRWRRSPAPSCTPPARRSSPSWSWRRSATDRFVAAVGTWRAWDKQNAWLAPLLTLALALPVTGLEVWLTGSMAATQAAHERAAAGALATQVPALADGSPAVIISDEPIGFALATGRPTLILPDEPPTDVLRLARQFGARAVLIFGEVERQAPGLDGAPCFSPGTLPPAAGARTRLYLIDRQPACVP